MEHPKDLQTNSTTHTAIQAQNATVSELIPPDLLTIILTTSPIPSAPSSELVQNTLASLPPCFKGVPIVLTFDGYKISKTEKGQLKRGKVPEEIVATYPEYIENVKNLFSGRNEDSEIDEEGHFRSHATGVTFLRLKKRMGFAFSVKAGLDYVKTPYVMILQHDWLFTLPYPPISTLLSILQDEAEDVKYIGFVARMSKDYIKQKKHQHNFKMVFQMSAELRKDRPLGNEMISCFHWFDRPHFTSVEIYKKIFDLGILRRGDFIEDTFGTKYLTSISSAKTDEEAFEEWKKFGAWMYYPFNGKEVSVRHGSGRTNLLGEREEERVQQLIKGCQEKTTRDWKTEKIRAEGEGCYEEFLGDLHGEEPQE